MCRTCNSTSEYATYELGYVIDWRTDACEGLEEMSAEEKLSLSPNRRGKNPALSTRHQIHHIERTRSLIDCHAITVLPALPEHTSASEIDVLCLQYLDVADVGTCLRKVHWSELLVHLRTAPLGHKHVHVNASDICRMDFIRNPLLYGGSQELRHNRRRL